MLPTGDGVLIIDEVQVRSCVADTFTAKDNYDYM